MRLPRKLRRRRENGGRMTAQASLAEAEATRRREERKKADAERATDKLRRLEQENDLAFRFRQAFSGR